MRIGKALAKGYLAADFREQSFKFDMPIPLTDLADWSALA